MKASIAKKSRNSFKTLAILSVLAVLIFMLAGPIQAWDLKEAAKPYEGATIRTIGEALPPLEALDKVKEKIAEMAATYENPQEVVQYYTSDKNRMAEIESFVLEEMVVNWACEQGKTEDRLSLPQGTGQAVLRCCHLPQRYQL